MAKPMFILFFTLILSLSVNSYAAGLAPQSCPILLSLVEKLKTPSAERKLELADVPFSWKVREELKSPRSRAVVDEIEKELNKDKYGARTEDISKLKKLIKKIRNNDYPLRKFQELIFKYYELRRDEPIDWGWYLKYSDESRLLEEPLKKLKIKPEIVFTFQELDFLDLSLAAHAGILYIGATHQNGIIYDFHKVPQSPSYYTSHDYEHHKNLLRRIADGQFSDIGKMSIEELKLQYELYKKVVVRVLQEKDPQMQLAYKLLLFFDFNTQNKFLFEQYKMSKEKYKRWSLYSTDQTFYSLYTDGFFGPKTLEAKLTKEILDIVEKQLAEIIIDVVESGLK